MMRDVWWDGCVKFVMMGVRGDERSQGEPTLFMLGRYLEHAYGFTYANHVWVVDLKQVLL